MENSVKLKIINQKEWDSILKNFTDSHFMQTSLWANIKVENGWKPHYLVWVENDEVILAGAMVLERKIRLFRFLTLKIHYVPKGPLFNCPDNEKIKQVLSDLKSFSKLKKGIFIKIDPDLIFDAEGDIDNHEFNLNVRPDYKELFQSQNWIEASEQIQFKNTIIIPLDKPGDQILMQMKQKTRYNIRLSEKKGVKVRIGDQSDLVKLYNLYAETAMRDNFVIRSQEYYLRVWSKFIEAGYCEPIIAEFEGVILAAVIIYFFSDKAYYVYGMSSEKNRNLMATYLLQWKSILRAKEKKCKYYDFWGAPEEISESDRMWGVYKFKIGFGGIFIRTIGAWDYPTNKFGYFSYNIILPKILFIMRKLGFRRIQKQLDN